MIGCAPSKTRPGAHAPSKSGKDKFLEVEFRFEWNIPSVQSFTREHKNVIRCFPGHAIRYLGRYTVECRSICSTEVAPRAVEPVWPAIEANLGGICPLDECKTLH